MTDCAAAWAAVQRAAAGAPVPERELEQALLHVASCPSCTGRLEPTVAADDLFERALVEGLAHPEALVRARAAAQVPRVAGRGPEALRALAEAAERDPDEGVRAAAAAALDEAVAALVRQLEDEWPSAAGEPAHGLDDTLALLTGPAGRSEELAGASLRGAGRVIVSGAGGLTGRIETRENELWLVIYGLPADLEGTTLLVAMPGALEPSAPALDWAGERMGLVTAGPVRGGSLTARLARADDPSAGEALFGRFYLVARPVGAPPI